MSIESKVAIITGATSGVGRATASVFAARGAKVIAVGRREELRRELEADARGKAMTAGLSYSTLTYMVVDERWSIG